MTHTPSRKAMLAQDSAAFAGVCRSSRAHTEHSHFALMHPPTSTELTCYAAADNKTDKACIQQSMLNRLNCCWCIEYNIIIYNVYTRIIYIYYIHYILYYIILY